MHYPLGGRTGKDSEGGRSAIAVEMFNVIEGLEEILFARLESEQFSEAVILLDLLRERLQHELPSESE